MRCSRCTLGAVPLLLLGESRRLGGCGQALPGGSPYLSFPEPPRWGGGTETTATKKGTARCRLQATPPARSLGSAPLAGTLRAGEPWRAGLRLSPAARVRGRADLCGQVTESWATGRASALPQQPPGRRALLPNQGRAAEVT